MLIDKYLNKITMYRLTLYYLIGLVIYSIITGFFGLTLYGSIDIIFSTIIVLFVCSISNWMFAKFFKAVTNVESVFITSLIIILIFPMKFPHQAIALIGVSLLAMGSKYLLTVEKRHLFNPAAVAVVMISLLSPEHSATWWVGTPLLIVPTLVGGLLLARKVQRMRMTLVFFVAYFFLAAIAALLHGNSILSLWQRGATSSALFFFAFIMLTEPLTSPSTKKMRTWYSLIVAALYSTPILRLGGLVFTPEMALVVGNIFSFIVNPKYRFELTLFKKVQLSPDTFLFDFGHVKNFKFIPGQYMEWTLPHSNSDSRGNRRYFSIASAPHEDLSMAVKFYTPSSSFKRTLLSLQPGQKIISSSLSGDFIMPKTRKTPLVFIAGGVGIAPFRSIIEDIIEKKEQVDIILLFANKKREDILFFDTFEKARSYGVNTIYILTDNASVPQSWQGITGHVTPEIIQTAIPDFSKRKFYVSGPQLMVQNFEKILLSSGVSKINIKVDFFPGYQETVA